MAIAGFPVCPICRSDRWTAVYDWPVRDGSFGVTKPGHVARCGSCCVKRLGESSCLPDDAYSGSEYRHHIGQDHDLLKHYATHDELARFTLGTLWPLSLRGKVVAYVGYCGGSLPDHIRGLPEKMIAIDPAKGFESSLRARKFDWFESARNAAHEYAGKVDVALSIQLIEHVSDPRTFLADIRALLKPDGVLVVSTPNRADILMDLLPDKFPGFFYRTQHRWAFNVAALTRCAAEAGIQVKETRHIHRCGVANTMLWLCERKPSGRAGLPPLDRAADDMWRTWLEATGRADNLYILLRSI